MAGAGYKLFNTGDVLTAAQVNTYLQEQAVMRFANATARTTALSGVLAEGMMSYLDDTNSVEVYNGSAWVSVGSTGDITAVTAGTGISGGGTSGDVTITNSMATAIDAKGDLIAGTGADAFSRLAVGANNTVLTADSSTATGLKWATVASGGISILGQKTITAGTNYTTTSTTQTAVNTTNFRVSITTGSSTTIVVILKGAAQIGGGAVNSWSVSLGAGTTYEMVACNSNYIGVNEACTVHIVTGLTANTAYNVDWTYRTSSASQAAQIIGDSSNQYPRMVVLG